jgi:hypothetical protein
VTNLPLHRYLGSFWRKPCGICYQKERTDLEAIRQLIEDVSFVCTGKKNPLLERDPKERGRIFVHTGKKVSPNQAEARSDDVVGAGSNFLKRVFSPFAKDLRGVGTPSAKPILYSIFISV